MNHSNSDEELLTSLKPGALVFYNAKPDKWTSPAEAHPMLVLEVARVKDLTMMRFKLLADWPAAWVLRSDGAQRTYPISWLKQLCNDDANPKTWT
jgi:hypothetical protein